MPAGRGGAPPAAAPPWPELRHGVRRRPSGVVGVVAVVGAAVAVAAAAAEKLQ